MMTMTGVDAVKLLYIGVGRSCECPRYFSRYRCGLTTRPRSSGPFDRPVAAARVHPLSLLYPWPLGAAAAPPPQGDRHQRADERYPHSELLLYKNLALSDAGMTKEALDHLEDCKDKVRYLWRRACVVAVTRLIFFWLVHGGR